MKNITFNLTALHTHGEAFWEYLRLRKFFFVDQLGWDIPHNDEFEMDQYDTPVAWYSIVLDKGRVIGGARIMATSARWGAHSYMLKDAVEGKLVDIPPEVLSQAMETNKVWECTRLVMSDAVKTHRERTQCLGLIVDGLAGIAAQQGARELMSLSPLSLMRALRQLGYDAGRVGAPYFNPGDGRKYAVLSMPTQKMSELVAA